MKKIIFFGLLGLLVSSCGGDIVELPNDITITDGNTTIFIPKHEIFELYSCIDLNINKTINGSYNWRYVTVETNDSIGIVKFVEWEYIDKFADPRYIEQIYNDCVFIGQDDLGYAFKECNKNAIKEKRNLNYLEIKKRTILKQLKKYIK